MKEAYSYDSMGLNLLSASYHISLRTLRVVLCGIITFIRFRHSLEFSSLKCELYSTVWADLNNFQRMSFSAAFLQRCVVRTLTANIHVLLQCYPIWKRLGQFSTFQFSSWYTCRLQWHKLNLSHTSEILEFVDFIVHVKLLGSIILKWSHSVANPNSGTLIKYELNRAPLYQLFDLYYQL